MFEIIIRKPVIVISNQVGHKPGLTDTENGYRVSDEEACGIDLFPYQLISIFVCLHHELDQCRHKPDCSARGWLWV